MIRRVKTFRGSFAAPECRSPGGLRGGRWSRCIRRNDRRFGADLLHENANIFEPAVESLSVERHHSVGRITDEDRPILVVVRLALDAPERTRLARQDISNELFLSDEGQRVWEVLLKNARMFSRSQRLSRKIANGANSVQK